MVDKSFENIFVFFLVLEAKFQLKIKYSRLHQISTFFLKSFQRSKIDQPFCEEQMNKSAFYVVLTLTKPFDVFGEIENVLHHSPNLTNTHKVEHSNLAILDCAKKDAFKS